MAIAVAVPIQVHIMRLTLATGLLVLVPVSYGQDGQGAASATDRIHPYLRQRMDASAPGERLSVYFAFEETLDYGHFLPRIRGLEPDQRRALVVGELRDHMQRTQTDLVRHLRGIEEASRADIVHRNYLGNFVLVEMESRDIAAAAQRDGVQRVWFNHVPPREEVEDSPSASLATGRRVGDGPQDTRANEVWAAGITGAGIVWMNADSGVRASQTNFASIHPGLAGRLWTNPGEIFGNGIDDDANGFTDDYYGWNFGTNTREIEDNGGHGSAGTGVFVAYEGSNELGNCPDARVMTGELSGEASQWAAIQYAIDHGAHGFTSSHSYKNNSPPGPNYKMHRDVGEASLAAGLMRVNSTSNNGGFCNQGLSISRPFNISAPGCLPPPWLHPDQTLEGGVGGVLGIGAHNVGTEELYVATPCGPFAWSLADLLAVRTYTLPWDPSHNDYPWSGGAQMGLLKPDLTGPQGTRSIEGLTGFGPFAGTSNGTPSVGSCLALAQSANPSLTPEDLAMAVQTTAVDRGTPGKDNSWGAGKVDAWELTKMARNILRVQDSVAHTVHASVAGGTLTIDVDGLPNTKIFLARGNGLATTQLGELTIRVAQPVLFATGTTDAQGNYSWSVPLQAWMIGASGYVQCASKDPAFGPLTGSNAVRIEIDA